MLYVLLSTRKMLIVLVHRRDYGKKTLNEYIILYIVHTYHGGVIDWPA